MKFRLQLVIEEDGHLEQVREIACLTREALSAETLGLRLEEGKQILSELQAQMAAGQVGQFIEEVSCCEVCQQRLARKDSKQIIMRTLYGKLKLDSPRVKRCQCREQPGDRKSFSPVAAFLPERTTPELKYLQTKWAALASYGLSVRFMEEAFPLQANTFASRQHVAEVATRLEDELDEEQPSFIEGIPLLW